MFELCNRGASEMTKTDKQKGLQTERPPSPHSKNIFTTSTSTYRQLQQQPPTDNGYNNNPLSPSYFST